LAAIRNSLSNRVQVSGIVDGSEGSLPEQISMQAASGLAWNIHVRAHDIALIVDSHGLGGDGARIIDGRKISTGQQKAMLLPGAVEVKANHGAVAVNGVWRRRCGSGVVK